MVGDHCKPLNFGASNTVRIIMGIEEAKRLWHDLKNGGGTVDELRQILERALERERALKGSL